MVFRVKKYQAIIGVILAILLTAKSLLDAPGRPFSGLIMEFVRSEGGFRNDYLMHPMKATPPQQHITYGAQHATNKSQIMRGIEKVLP
jgi:hypothetical protein